MVGKSANLQIDSGLVGKSANLQSLVPSIKRTEITGNQIVMSWSLISTIGGVICTPETNVKHDNTVLLSHEKVNDIEVPTATENK